MDVFSFEQRDSGLRTLREIERVHRVGPKEGQTEQDQGGRASVNRPRLPVEAPQNSMRLKISVE
jgi:hypothetical protein